MILFCDVAQTFADPLQDLFAESVPYVGYESADQRKFMALQSGNNSPDEERFAGRVVFF